MPPPPGQAEDRIPENRGHTANFKDDYTVGEWMWLWFETYSKPNLRPSTVDNYTNYIRYHIELNLGRIKLKQLTPLRIQQFYKEGSRVKRWEDMEDLSLSNRRTFTYCCGKRSSRR